MERFHPSAIFIFSLAFLLLMQTADAPAGLLLQGSTVLLAVLLARVGFARLLRRSRILLLTLAGLFLWSTPGRWLWPELGMWSPSWEGAVLALHQTVRLLAMIGWVALLHHALPLPRWMAGLWGVLAPWRWLGVDTGPFVIRLMLVMQQLEHSTVSWRSLWEAGASGVANEQAAGLAPLSLTLSEWQVKDSILLVLGLALLGLIGVV